jgi:hypothetical protein
MELGSYFLFLQEQIKDIIISTSYKEATNSQPSSATPLSNMVNNPGMFYAEQASLTLSGTSLLPSPSSSWQPRNTSPVRSPAPDTDDDDDNVTLPQPMNRMIGPEYPSCLWGARTP